jgi:hypothetical protein
VDSIPSLLNTSIPKDFLMEVAYQNRKDNYSDSPLFLRPDVKGTFVLDSGATKHMTPMKALLSNYKEKKGRVKMGNDHFIHSHGEGDCSIFRNVLFVPDLTLTLISVSELCTQNFVVIFSENEVYAYYGSTDGPLAFTAKLQDGLYVIDRELINNDFHTCQWMDTSSSTSESLGIAASYLNVTKDNSLQSWHTKWGHLHPKRMKQAVTDQLVTGVPLTSKDFSDIEGITCLPCLLGKMKASNRPGTSLNSHGVMEKIGIDFKGYFPVQCGGANGFFLLSDQNTGLCYVHFVRHKNENIYALQSFHDMYYNYTNFVWKILQSDYEAINHTPEIRDWLNSKHIKLQMSVPYAHWQNGQIERDIQNVMDTARILMSSFPNIPFNVWGWAVQTSVYVLNRSPSKGRDKTPYELVTGTKPDISHLIPFYCPGVYHLTADERKHDKAWKPKAMPCRFLGYDEYTKDGYFIMDVQSGHIHTRRDCVFDPEWNVHDYLRDTEIDFQEIQDSVLDEDRLIMDGEGTSSPVITSPRPDFPRILDSGITDEHDYDSQVQDITDFPPDIRESSASESSPHYPLPNGPPSSGTRSHDPNLPGREVPFVTGNISFAGGMGVGKLTANEATKQTHKGNVYLSQWFDDTVEMVLTTAAATESPLSNTLSLPSNPKSIRDALVGNDAEKWKDAICQEFKQMEDMGVLQAAPQKGRALKSKMVLKVSFDNRFSLKYKARWVILGFMQKFGVDYKETFSPTTHITTVFILLMTAAQLGLYLSEFDIGGAFLEGLNDVELYVYLPKDVTPDSMFPLRYRVIKSLYGEKQAPKIWNDFFNGVLTSKMSFRRCPIDPCLYIRNYGENEYVMVSIHVDDGLVVATSTNLLDEFYKELRSHVKKLTIYEDVQKFLGMELTRDTVTRNCVNLSQNAYISDKFDDLQSYLEASFGHHFRDNSGLQKWKKSRLDYRIPMSSKFNLRLTQPDESNPSLLPVVGTLRYLADRTRPDILLAVGEASSGGAVHPSKDHVSVVKQCVDYILATKEHSLKFERSSTGLQLFGYCDASYVTTGNCKSRLGGCLFLNANSGAFCSFSKTDTTVSHSSTEAELKALDELLKQLIKVTEILMFLGIKLSPEPIPVLIDNKSAIELSNTLKSGNKVGYINVRMEFIRELINLRMIKLVYVPTELNVADVLTKPLSHETFERHSQVLLYGHSGNLPYDSSCRTVSFAEV